MSGYDCGWPPSSLSEDSGVNNAAIPWTRNERKHDQAHCQSEESRIAAAEANDRYGDGDEHKPIPLLGHSKLLLEQKDWFPYHKQLIDPNLKQTNAPQRKNKKEARELKAKNPGRLRRGYNWFTSIFKNADSKKEVDKNVVA